jgi:hypothetical protein
VFAEQGGKIGYLKSKRKMEEENLILEIMEIVKDNQYNLGQDSNKTTVCRLLDLLRDKRGLELKKEDGVS